jgi:hypothetical protein
MGFLLYRIDMPITPPYWEGNIRCEILMAPPSISHNIKIVPPLWGGGGVGHLGMECFD